MRGVYIQGALSSTHRHGTLHPTLVSGVYDAMQSIDATIGPAEVCAVISFFFYGVMAVQVYLYCQSDFLEDSLLTKSTVRSCVQPIVIAF